MAEYKNGVNYAGNMSVNTDDVSPDVVTGRAVFVDDDKYENDSKYKSKVDKCVEEGFYKVSSSDTGSSSGSGGSSGGGNDSGAKVIALTATYDESTDTSYLDKTWREIDAAIGDGNILIQAWDQDGGHEWQPAINTFVADNKYQVSFRSLLSSEWGSDKYWKCDSPDDYPAIYWGD